MEELVCYFGTILFQEVLECSQHVRAAADGGGKRERELCLLFSALPISSYFSYFKINGHFGSVSVKQHEQGSFSGTADVRLKGSVVCCWLRTTEELLA